MPDQSKSTKTFRKIKSRSKAVMRYAGFVDASPVQNLLDQIEAKMATGHSALSDYRLTFVVGASGSGTTLLTKVLAHPTNAVCLGGKYWTISESDAEATNVMHLFNKAISRLWDRHGSAERYTWASNLLPHIIDHLREQTTYTDRDHIIYKRSAPFNFGDQYRPDISDLDKIFPEVRVVVIYRDPRASTHSSMRREFAHSLRQMAIICEENLTYLNAQLEAFDPDRFTVIPYEAFCSQPKQYTGQLADLCGMAQSDLDAAVDRWQVNDGQVNRWQEELSSADKAYLNQHFDPTRRSQWPLLDQAAQTTPK